MATVQTVRKYRVGHARTEDEAIAAAGVPQIGSVGPAGVAVGAFAYPWVAGFHVWVWYEAEVADAPAKAE